VKRLSSASGFDLTIGQRFQYWHYGPVSLRRTIESDVAPLLNAWLIQLDAQEPLLHAILSDGLTGPFQPAKADAYAAAIATIQNMAATEKP
jgi:hypothetical protein